MIERTVKTLDPEYQRQIPCQASHVKPKHFATVMERWQSPAMAAPAFNYWCDEHLPYGSMGIKPTKEEPQMSTWTKGPWALGLGYTEPEGEIIVESPQGEGMNICAVFERPDRRANARLISLAPELAEEVDTLCCLLEVMLKGLHPTEQEIRSRNSQARALLARLGKE